MPNEIMSDLLTRKLTESGIARESFNESTSLKLFYHREEFEKSLKFSHFFLSAAILNNLSEYQLSIDVTNKCLQNRLLAQIRNPLVEQIHFLSPFSSRDERNNFHFLRN